MRRSLQMAAAGGIAVILLSGVAVADPLQPLPLHRALNLALERNGELRAMKEEQGRHEGERLTASTRPNPLLELEGSSGAPFGTAEDYGVSLGLSQEFVTAGKLTKRRMVADRALEAYQWRLADRKRLLIEEVTVAYRELQFCAKRSELAATARDLSRQLLSVATERFNADDIPELELNLAKVAQARSDARILEAQRELLPARTRLAELTGEGAQVEVEVKVEVEVEVEPLRAPLPPLPELLEGLELRRPDLRALATERAKGEAEQEAARADAIPNVTASLFYRHDEMTFEIDRSQGLKRDNTLGVRFSIPLPLFDRNQGRIREATARTSQSQREYETAVTAARREVATAHARLQLSEKLLNLYDREILPQLDENLKLMGEAYRVGEVGLLSVIEEQRKFMELHDGYLAELKSGQIARSRLESAAGIPHSPPPFPTPGVPLPGGAP